MQNTQNHQCPKCEIHHFSLKMVAKERRPNLTTNLSLCRGKQIKNRKARSKCPNYEGPILNKDKVHASPTFILSSEKIEYLQSARQILREHERRVRQAEEDNDDLYIPKPRSKNMYCNVCRQNYQEYIDHIHSNQHKSNIKNSQFNRDIIGLTKMFKSSPAKEETIVLTETGTRDDQDDSVQIIGSISRKKIKVNPEDPAPGTYPAYPYQHNPMRQQNPYMMTQQPNYFSPFGMMNPYPYYNPYPGGMPYPPYNNFFEQQMRGFPMFCGSYQPSINIDLFSQR